MDRIAKTISRKDINSLLLKKQLRDVLRMQKGSSILNFEQDIIFNNPDEYLELFNVVSEGHIFILRKENRKIKFYYTSLGTGTRLHEIDIFEIPKTKPVYIAFTWSPQESILYIDKGYEFIKSIGFDSSVKFRALKGKVLEFKNVDIESLRFYSQEGNIKPTAIDSWKEIIKGLNILNESYKDNQHELITVNLSLASLVTGFENYLKNRFIELEKEGVKPNEEKLIKSIFSTHERESRFDYEDRKSAKELGLTLIEKLARDKIKFQNYNECKKVFNKTYNLKFSELGMTISKMNELKKYIGYRHKIMHVSPMLPILNEEEIPSKNPIIPKKILIENAIVIFDEFIKKFHNKSLE